MEDVKVESDVLKFIEVNTRVMDMVLNSTGVKIIRASAILAPVDEGNLLSTHMLERIGLMDFEVSYNKSGLAPYARRWEYETPPGGFKKPGATSHYLSTPAKEYSKASAMVPLFKRAAESIQL